MMDTYMIAGFVILGVLLPISTFVLGIYWNSRNIKRQDEEAIKKEVARETTVDLKLDSISRTVNSIDLKIENMQESINKLERKNSVTEEKLMEHDRRFSDIDRRINETEDHLTVLRDQLQKLHQEHRERVVHCHAQDTH